MDFDLLLILPFIIIVVAIVMGTLGGIAKRHIRYKERELEARTAKPTENLSQIGDVMRAMEERLRVLERIATDHNDDLARQIEDLRKGDERPAELQTREKAQ